MLLAFIKNSGKEDYKKVNKLFKIANIISISRGVVFTIALLIVLPLVMGDIGIWISIILGEVCTLLLIICLMYVKKIDVNLNN